MIKLTKYIDLKTFDIIENPTFFDVDDNIAEAVSILNKNGYITISSCAGHNKNGFLMPTIREPIEYYSKWIKKYQNDSSVHLVDKDDKFFYHKDEEEATCIYICFKEKYDFDFLPDGFEFSDSFDKYSVYKMCYFFKDGKRRLDKDIDSELIHCQEVLLDWAKNLKKLNKDIGIDGESTILDKNTLNYHK